MALNWETIPESITKLPIQEPLQAGIINELAQQGKEYFDPKIQEQYTRKQFAKQLPGFAERLNMQSGGQGMSQAAQFELGAQQANLEDMILGQRYQHGLEALKLGLTPQAEYLYKEPQAGLKEEFARKLIGNLAEKAPELVGKGGELIWNAVSKRFEKKPQGQQTTGEALTSGLAGGTAGAVGGAATGAAIDKAFSPAKEQGTELAAKTAVENQTAQKLSNEAGTGAAEGTAGAVGGAVLGKAALTGAAKITPLMAAAIGWGVPVAIAATGFFGIKAYEYYQDLMKQQFGTSIPPLPGNWNELSGPERYKEQTSRQMATPGGQVTHDEIEHLEREFGIHANGKVSWEQRWKNVTNKVAELEQQKGIQPSNVPWPQRYRVAKEKKGK